MQHCIGDTAVEDMKCTEKVNDVSDGHGGDMGGMGSGRGKGVSLGGSTMLAGMRNPVNIVKYKYNYTYRYIE